MATRKYDWVKLKQEWMLGDDLSVNAFIKRKNITAPKDYLVGWAGEKEEYKKKMMERSLAEVAKQEVEDITKVRERQARLAKFLQLKGAEKLKNMDIETVEDARKLVVSGLQEERRALGMEGAGATPHNTFNQINIGPKLNIDKLLDTLDYEGILNLIADLKRERARRSIQPSTAQGAGEIQEGEVV